MQRRVQFFLFSRSINLNPRNSWFLVPVLFAIALVVDAHSEWSGAFSSARDRISKEKRSKIMSAIRSENTQPEIILRKALWA